MNKKQMEQARKIAKQAAVKAYNATLQKIAQSPELLKAMEAQVAKDSAPPGTEVVFNPGGKSDVRKEHERLEGVGEGEYGVSPAAKKTNRPDFHMDADGFDVEVEEGGRSDQRGSSSEQHERHEGQVPQTNTKSNRPGFNEPNPFGVPKKDAQQHAELMRVAGMFESTLRRFKK